MQVTGIIQSVVSRMKNGYPETFTTPNGQFWVFDMTINGQTGQINSKSQVYPKQVGQEISVNTEQDQNGNVKFRAFNPQYQQGQQPPQQQAPPQQPPQQSYAPPPQTPPQANNVQARIQFAQALNRACDDRIGGLIDKSGIAAAHCEYLTILQTEQFPPSMMSTAPPEQIPNAEPEVQFPTDEIPY